MCPSTNNSLEAFDRVIKDEHTLRERLVLSRFTTVMNSMVWSWSLERDTTRINSKAFEMQPKISQAQWISAYHRVKSDREVVVIEEESKNVYYVPAGEEKRLSDKEVKRYENGRFNSFDSYKSVVMSIWRLELA